MGQMEMFNELWWKTWLEETTRKN